MPNISAFLSYVFIATFTPGPNNIMSMSNAAKYGFKKSIPFNIGVFIGFFLIMIISGFFSVTLYSLIPSIKPFMSFAGALYILWLAWKIFNSKINTNENNRHNIKTSSAVILQFLNAKAIIYAFTALSTFIVPYYKSWYEIFLFSVLLSFTAFISTCSWSVFGSVFKKAFVQHEKFINALMAVLLVYSAASLFF